MTHTELAHKPPQKDYMSDMVGWLLNVQRGSLSLDEVKFELLKNMLRSMSMGYKKFQSTLFPDDHSVEQGNTPPAVCIVSI